ncbi:MAG: SPOR domain-containing protein [Desulfovibrionaceae bacterium]
MSRRTTCAHFLARSRALFAMALLVLCVLGDLRPSLAVPAAPAPPGLTVEACGSLSERSEGATGQRPAPFARSGLVLEPGDHGLGCRFRIGGGPGGETVLVEVRLTRPGLVGGGRAVDRWYVPARRGETALAGHLFEAAGEIAPGQWDLALYLDDQLQAERRFEVRGTPQEASPTAVEPPPAPGLPSAPALAAAPPLASPPPLVPDTPGARSGHSPQETTAADLEIVLAPEPASDGVPEAWAASLPPSAPPARKTAHQTPQPTASRKDASPSSLPASSAKTGAYRPDGQAPAKSPSPSGKTAVAPAKPAPEPRASSPASVAKSPSAPSGQATGYYALQTGIFSMPGNAENQAARLRGRGLPACVAAESGAGRTRYRVLAGRYGDRQAAQASRDEVGTAVGGGAVLFRVDPSLAARLRCH